MYVWMKYNIIHTYTYYVFNRISIIQKSKYSIIRTLPYLHYLYFAKIQKVFTLWNYNMEYMKMQYRISEYRKCQSSFNSD